MKKPLPLRRAFVGRFLPLLLLIGCNGEVAPEPSGSAGAGSGADRASQLTAAPLRLEFPTIPFGRSAEAAYELTNSGSTTLRLTSIGPAPCDCAQLRLERPLEAGSEWIDIDREGVPYGMGLELAPSETVRLHLRLDTARYREPRSRLIGGFAVRAEGQPTMMLEYVADVFTPYMVEPWAIELGEVGARERAVGIVGIHPHDAKEFQPIVPDVDRGWEFALEELPEEHGTAWRIQVTAPAELPLGPFDEAFEFKSNLPDAPPIQFHVQGVAVPDLRAAPSLVKLRDVGADRPPSNAVIVETRARDLTFHIDRLELLDVNPDWFELSYYDLEPGKRFRIVLKYRGPLPDEPVTGRLAIYTTDLEQPRLEVNLQVVADL